MHLSAHVCHHVFKLARTIADLAGSEQIQAPQRSSIGQAALCVAERRLPGRNTVRRLERTRDVIYL